MGPKQSVILSRRVEAEEGGEKKRSAEHFVSSANGWEKHEVGEDWFLLAFRGGPAYGGGERSAGTPDLKTRCQNGKKVEKYKKTTEKAYSGTFTLKER